VVAFFEKATEQEKAMDEKFAGRPLLEMTYEDLITNFQDQMKSVQEYLYLNVKTITVAGSNDQAESGASKRADPELRLRRVEACPSAQPVGGVCCMRSPHCEFID
jgi:hypothetical protein